MTGVKKPVATEVVGTAVGLTIRITDDCNMTFQSGFAEDESDAVVNARLDRLQSFAARQHAIANIPLKQNARNDLLKQIMQYEADLTHVETDLVDANASLDQQVMVLHEKIAETERAGEEQYRTSGRVGAYKPRGPVAANIERFQAQIKSTLEGKEKNAAERDKAVQDITAAVEHRRKHLAIVETELAEFYVKAGMEPPEG